MARAHWKNFPRALPSRSTTRVATRPVVFGLGDKCAIDQDSTRHHYATPSAHCPLTTCVPLSSFAHSPLARRARPHIRIVCGTWAWTCCVSRDLGCISRPQMQDAERASPACGSRRDLRSHELGDRVDVIVGLDWVLGGEKLVLRGDAGECQAREEAVVLGDAREMHTE